MALSIDIRRRIFAASKAGEGSVRSLAKRFSVGISSVQRLIDRERQTGTIEPKPHAGGSKPIIPDELLSDLVSLVQEKPDRTTTELRDEWQKRSGIYLGHGTMIRALQRAELTLKKNLSRSRTRFGEKPREAQSF